MRHSHISNLEREVKDLNIRYETNSAKIYWRAELDTRIFPPQNQHGTDDSVTHTKHIQKCLQEWVLTGLPLYIGLTVHFTKDAILCQATEGLPLLRMRHHAMSHLLLMHRQALQPVFFWNQISITVFSCLREVKQWPLSKKPRSI